MTGYNRVILAGNLTRDPDYKVLASGQGVCRLGLAVNRQYKNRQSGELVQEVCFVDIDVWGAQAESVSQYLQKGRPVLVEGRLKFDTWQDQDGQTRSKHSVVADRVVFLGSQGQDPNSDSSGNSDFDYGSQRSGSGTGNPDSSVGTSSFAGAGRNGAQTSKKLDQSSKASGSVKRGSGKRDSRQDAPEIKDEAPFEDDLPF